MVSKSDVVRAQEDTHMKQLYDEIRLQRMHGTETLKWRKMDWEPKLDEGGDLLLTTRKQKKLLLVPEKFIPLVLRLKHDDARHFGVRRTEALLRRLVTAGSQ